MIISVRGRGLFLSRVCCLPPSSRRKKKKRKEKEVELNCTTRRALDLIKGKLFLVRLLEAGPGFPVGFVNHSLLDDPGVGKAE